VAEQGVARVPPPPATDFADRSRAPRTWPQQVASETEQASVGLRRALEAGATPDTR
jgi:hypothetical protein